MQAYKAMCTPEFYCFDGDLKLCYHGRFDDSRPGTSKPVTGKELRRALDAMIVPYPTCDVDLVICEFSFLFLCKFLLLAYVAV